MARRYVRLADQTKSLGQGAWRISRTQVKELPEPLTSEMKIWLRNGVLIEMDAPILPPNVSQEEVDQYVEVTMGPTFLQYLEQRNNE